MQCLMCGRGLNDLCETPEECSTSNRSKSGNNIAALASGLPDVEEKRKRGRPFKSPEQISDPKSTGRKRAAILYPLDKNKPCEWRNLANVGGGKFPIIGCIEGFQEERHHGPDKNTLNNERENVHLICDDCHNIWHSQNDKDYPAEEIQSGRYLHEPRSATKSELVARLAKMAYQVKDVACNDGDGTDNSEDKNNGPETIGESEFGIVLG